MTNTFTVQETQERRYYAITQIQVLESTHQKLEHEGKPLNSCRVCLGYMIQIKDLSIPAKDLPRFRQVRAKIVNF